MNVPNGSIITWVGSWSRTLSERVSGSSSSDISAQLGQFGFKVISVDIATGFLDQVFGSSVTGTVTVQTTGGDYTDGVSGLGNGDDQVRQNIEMAIYQATGSFPIGSQISGIALPEGAKSTGPASPGTTTTTTCGSGIDGFFQKLLGNCKAAPTAKSTASTGFSLSSFGSSTVLYVGLAIFGFVAALALIGYSGALRRV